MDCDDNDFQNQNFQLIGEDNDEFPRSLQPYDPPKFEIDDHFHSHLRFDSLAETGLFLGIQGEENNWIEEFSPRNTAIEFGSSTSQTCSISVHDNIWSNAPSSESSQMLVKSVGDDEISPRVMNRGAEAHAVDDSSRTEEKSVAHTDSTHSTEKLHNSSLGSNDVVGIEEPKVSPQTQEAETSEALLSTSTLDKKFDSTGKVVASPFNVSEELTSSSGGVSKSCLDSGELINVVQSKEPLDKCSARNSSPDDCGCTVNKGPETNLSCNSQDGALVLSTENATIRTGKLDDMSERSNFLQSENKQKETSSNQFGDSTLNDCHFRDETLNTHACVIEDSSDLVSSIDSLMLPNEGSSNTEFLKNSDGLLEAIAYQVKVLNKDPKVGDNSSTCIEELPSVAMERDGTVMRKSVEVGVENSPELCNVPEPAHFGQGLCEFISKEDGLNPHSSSTKESQLIGLGEERDPSASKADISDNCTELSSSDMEVKVEFSCPMKAETRVAEAKDFNGYRIDPPSSNNSDIVQTEKGAEAECLESVTEEPTGNLDASELAILKEPCATLLDNAENKVSSSIHDKLAPMSETNSVELAILKEPCATLLDNAENKVSSSIHDKLAPMSETNSAVTELNEIENNVHLDKDKSSKLIDSSQTEFKSFSAFIENTEISSSDTQSSVADLDSEGAKLPSNDYSTNAHKLQPEVEAIAEEKQVTAPSIAELHSDEKDEQVYPLSDIRSSTNTNNQITAVADSDANDLPLNNCSDGPETANNVVRLDSSAGVSSLATDKNTEEKSTNLAPTNNSDKPKFPETEFDTSHNGRDNLPKPTLPESNVESCLLDPEGGKQSSCEPNCGSPTVISCNERTLKEMEHRESNSSFQDPAGPASETTRSSDSFKGIIEDSKVSTASEDDGNFTFVVQPDTDISKKESNKDQQLLCKIQSLEQPQVPKENSQECQNVTFIESTSSFRSVEEKKKPASARATRKVGTPKDVKEKSQEKQGRGRKKAPRSSTSPASSRVTRSKTDTEGIQQCLYGGTNIAKSSCSPNIQTSNLPDLNTSAPLLFHQPFTDSQQVQLRAQIFVYGSLIQGVLPDEACMIPAFGGSDGGRSLWEQAWRAASERFLNQKSPPNTSGTHLHYHSEGVTCSPLQSKALNSPAGRRDSKVPVSSIQSPIVSLQSPLQSSSNDGLPSSITRGIHFESNQSPSPFHSYQTSQIRQYLTNSTPWLSPSPQHTSWVFSSQSSPFDSNTQYSASATTEIAQVTPSRDSSKARMTNVQLASPSVSLPNQGAASVSAALAVSVVAPNKEATPVSTKNTSVGEKSRKRKKISASEELLPKFSFSQPQPESASAPSTINNLPNPSCLSLSSTSQSTVTSTCPVSATSHATTMPYLQLFGSGDPQHRVIFSKEAFSHIEQSKMQADNASSSAAAAVRHSQVIWEQMAAGRKTGFASEVEEKLASAAVAAAAAASVAKAAAEVAKVASEAALQAKLMADDALNSSITGNITKNSDINLDVDKKMLTSIPASVPKGKDKISGLSIISAARETTRKRVEAASAAIKRAENMDAIARAAEMAVEAVSQVGTIIAMGDPVPFSINELLIAGPDNHWKLHCMTMKNGTETNAQAKENLGLHVTDNHEAFTKQSNNGSTHSGRRKVSLVEMPPNNQKSILLQESHEVHGLENGSNAGPARDPMKGIGIQKGSLVEVVGDEEGRRGTWFSALVVDVKDDKAYVCYNDLSGEGHDKLKEWVPLKSKSDQPPRIRLAHRVLEAKPEVTRKRRREAVGNITWAVGDRVDAWIRDGWREGVVTEKNQDDETKLTVHFPAGGDTTIVSTWSLRPSLIWNGGQWIECPRAKEVTLESYQGDTPLGKRQKLGQPDVKSKSDISDEGTMIVSRNIHANESGKLEERQPLNLSANDVIFSVGKNVVEENNNGTLKVRRAGLQKDGSKVVFGVPKPGKKRKFMEVSKHYTADKKTEKATESSDSMKFTKYLIPQASQLWRNSSKGDVKGKQTINSNTRGSKSLRSQNIQAKSNVDKDKSITTISVSNRVESSLRTSSTQEKNNSLEAASFTHPPGKVDIAVVESSMQPVPAIPSSNKRRPLSVEAEMGEKEKTSAVDQFSSSELQGFENPGKRSADIMEPRRSNRRIQPTSRLLEGLQSALIISKSPTIPHDRVAKSLHKGVSASRGQSHG
ncbi:hypothetical protein Cni_G14973 [Canna indica]|uniref:Agenet domain-containing protein n=1 Tax=Canna indica TaxID=4628 RepID=A0AAQ3QEB5_9LILI|nr:hypothetical protein Cni_G14973 [Canna indica]